MAALQTIIASLDDVEENLRAFYKEQTVKGTDGKDKKVIAIDLEGADQHPAIGALRNAHERQKAETTRLKTELAEAKLKGDAMPEGFTIEEWERLLAVDETVKAHPDDPEKKKLHDAEVQSIKAMHVQQLERQKKASDLVIAEKDKRIATLDSAHRNVLVGDGLTKALVEAGVQKHFLTAVRAMLEKSVKVVEDDGKFVPSVETDLGDTPIDQFVAQWAQSDQGKVFITPAKGADATGGDGKKPGTGYENNPFMKAHWNATIQGQIYKAEPAKAERLAKAAGHKAAAGAKIQQAK